MLMQDNKNNSQIKYNLKANTIKPETQTQDLGKNILKAQYGKINYIKKKAKKIFIYLLNERKQFECTYRELMEQSKLKDENKCSKFHTNNY